MKTKTRGIRLSLFPLFLILVLASVGMASAATTVTVSPSTQTVEEGQTFTIDIDVTPSAATDKVQVDLTFDQSLVTANNVANGGMFANLVSNPIDNANGEITSICGYNSGGATTTTPGTLTTVTFTANVAGQSPLTLVDVIVLDGTTSLPNTPQSGSVTVTQGTTTDTIVKVSPSTQTVEEGQAFTIDIDVTHSAATDKVQVDLTFDQSLVTANNVANGGMFANLVSNPIDNANGEITSICGYNSGGATTTTPGTLTTVTFTANVAGQSPLTLVDVIVLDGTTSLPNTPQSGSVTIGDAVAKPQPRITAPAGGSTVTGTVAIKAVDDSGKDDIVRAVFECSTTETSWTEICDDTDGSDGWGCSWDTTAVADDDYSIRVTMYDAADQNGKSAISVSVDNLADPDYELDLDAGLNLVSIPKTINGTNDAETVFSLDPYAGEFCVYYNAFTGGYDVNPKVKQCRGYWVFKNAAETVGVSFDTDAGAVSQQLYEGWNMVGHVSLEAVPIYEEGNDADFGSLTGLEEPEESKLYRQVCAYTQAGGWEYYPAGDLTDMTPGMGAWILVRQDVMMYGMP